MVIRLLFSSRLFVWYKLINKCTYKGKTIITRRQKLYIKWKMYLSLILTPVIVWQEFHQRTKDTVASLKERLPLEHLCHDASHGPDVHWRREHTNMFTSGMQTQVRQISNQPVPKCWRSNDFHKEITWKYAVKTKTTKTNIAQTAQKEQSCYCDLHCVIAPPSGWTTSYQSRWWLFTAKADLIYIYTLHFCISLVLKGVRNAKLVCAYLNSNNFKNEIYLFKPYQPAPFIPRCRVTFKPKRQTRIQLVRELKGPRPNQPESGPAPYQSGCSASNSGWPLELCTSGSPHSPSFHCRPAVLNQSPRSAETNKTPHTRLSF